MIGGIQHDNTWLVIYIVQFISIDSTVLKLCNPIARAKIATQILVICYAKTDYV